MCSETPAEIIGVDPTDAGTQSRGLGMLPIQVIGPQCMEAFEADPKALEYRCPLCGAVFYPGEKALGTDLEDEI